MDRTRSARAFDGRASKFLIEPGTISSSIKHRYTPLRSVVHTRLATASLRARSWALASSDEVAASAPTPSSSESVLATLRRCERLSGCLMMAAIHLRASRTYSRSSFSMALAWSSASRPARSRPNTRSTLTAKEVREGSTASVLARRNRRGDGASPTPAAGGVGLLILGRERERERERWRKMIWARCVKGSGAEGQ